jgi:hypothetical protein
VLMAWNVFMTVRAAPRTSAAALPLAAVAAA